MAKLRGSLTDTCEFYSKWLQKGLAENDYELLIAYVKACISGLDKEANKFKKNAKRS